MKKNFKKLAVAALSGALVLGGAMAVYAAELGVGQWCTGTGAEANKYWFTLDPNGAKCIANTWHWVKDADGVVRCYYFDQNGWVVTNTTIDGETVDADGRWVKNGVVQTDNTKDYYTHSSSFIASAKNNTQNKPAASTNGKPSNVKGSGKGDNPSGATADALAYEISTINGYKVTNNWANFSMDLSSIYKPIEAGNAENGQDFAVSDSGAELVVRYLPIDKYKAGNTDLNAFVTSYLGDVREGMKGGSVAADIQLGAYSFKQITKKVPHPRMEMYDHTYIRQVEGTNYAQVISVKQNGIEQDYLSALNTIAKVR